MNAGITIEAAPMQGFLDHVVRFAHRRFFSGIDGWYTPFLLLEKGTLRSRDRRELQEGIKEQGLLIPQIAPSSPDEALQLLRMIKDAGFSSVNLNLGCPYPMMTKHGRGAGLLPFPNRIADILSALCQGTLTVSVKTRLGLTDANEFQGVVPVLNAFPLDKVIVHPRIASQQYGGVPNWEAFDRYAQALHATVVANGDMDTLDDVQQVMERYPFVSGVMIGRGLLKDPFLAMRIKSLSIASDTGKILRDFHDAVEEGYRQFLTPSHLLDKMTAFWSYFADCFPNSDKVFKKIKKSRQYSAYSKAVDSAFQTIDTP